MYRGESNTEKYFVNYNQYYDHSEVVRAIQNACMMDNRDSGKISNTYSDFAVR